MREIKFRAWHKNIKTMCENVETDLLDRDYLEFMQYTGMKDCNEVEIYEGDIVRYTFDLPESPFATENGLKVRIHQVFWSDFRGAFAVGNKKANNNLFMYVRNGNRVEVIGNIYENKDLL